jgi:HAD domain in Swiss Army Knife RNA repair proteins
MDERSRGLLDAAVREQLEAYGRVLPPCRAYPEIDPYSIGWRMGGGEWHLMVWWHWWRSAAMDEAARIAYFGDDEPPHVWLDWAAAQIWPDEDFGPAGVRRLANRGIGARPLLFLDVDGTLLPFAAIGEQSDEKSNPLLAGLDPEHGRRLAALPCDLVWATTWMDEANEVLTPRLGLPQLPVVDWPEEDDGDDRLHWKTRNLVEWAMGRPFVWVDDEISVADQTWIMVNHSSPALAHRVDPRCGLTVADYDAIEQWLATRVTPANDQH